MCIRDRYNTAGVAYFKEHGLLPLKGQPRQKTSLLARLRLGKANISVPEEDTVVRKAVFPSMTVSKAADQFRQQIRVGSDYFQDLILANAIRSTMVELTKTSGVEASELSIAEETFVEYATDNEIATPRFKVLSAFKAKGFGIDETLSLIHI